MMEPTSLPICEKFTPGPWMVEKRKTCSIITHPAAPKDGYSNRVAECPQWSPAPRGQPDADQAFANARLIAAAPDLYDALAEARLIVANLPHDESLFLAKIDAALAKARGETSHV